MHLVCVVRNQGQQLEALIRDASAHLSLRVRDYEFIIVDNASTDQSIDVFEKLTGNDGFPNLQIYALTKDVLRDILMEIATALRNRGTVDVSEMC